MRIRICIIPIGTQHVDYNWRVRQRADIIKLHKALGEIIDKKATKRREIRQGKQPVRDTSTPMTANQEHLSVTMGTVERDEIAVAEQQWEPIRS